MSDFDRWIDSALSSYSDAEPSLHLERRIINGLPKQSAPAWKWVFAVPIAAALFAAAFLFRTPVPIVPLPKIATAELPLNTSVAMLPGVRARSLVKGEKIRPFPLLVKVTENERAFLHFVELNKAVFASPSPETLNISSLEIKPLSIDAMKTGESNDQ